MAFWIQSSVARVDSSRAVSLGSRSRRATAADSISPAATTGLATFTAAESLIQARSASRCAWTGALSGPCESRRSIS